MKKSRPKNHGNQSGSEVPVKKTGMRVMLKRWAVPGLTSLVVIVLGTVAIATRPTPIAEVPVESGEEPVSILLATDVSLPQPDTRSNNSVEAVLKSRQTKRDFLDRELTLKQISQILWSAQGVTVDWGGRTAPSSKDTFPLSIYLIASKVSELEYGEYQYIPGDRTPVHRLRPIKKVDLQAALFEATNQSSFKSAPAVLVVTGNMNKMAEAYGGIPHDKEVFLEAGHVAENIALQAESLKLGTVVVTAYEDARIRELVTIPESETIIYLMPIGVPKQ